MSDSEVGEPYIYFHYNDRHKWCKKEDVSPKSLQSLFNLDNVVLQVESRNKKLVNIEDVKPNKHYSLLEHCLIDHQNHHVTNAVYASRAVYEDEPDEYLNKNMPYHCLDVVCDVTRFTKQRILLCIANDPDEEKTLYVSYMGTTSLEDVVENFDFDMVYAPTLQRSKCNKGFLERSNTLSSQSIFQCSQYYNVKTVVFCGHSLGGAVASLSALSLIHI